MHSQPSLSKLGRIFVTAAAFVVVLAGIKASGSLLIPFLLSVFLAFIAEMPLSWMQGKGVPRWLGLILVLCAGLFVEILLVAFIGSAINGFTEAFPQYQERLVAGLRNLYSSLAEWGIVIDRAMYDQVVERFDPGVIMGLASNLFSGLGNIFSNGFVILLTVVFILLEIPNLPGKLRRASPASAALSERVARFSETLKGYLGIKTAVSLLTGAAIALWLGLIGVDFPMLWGFLAFLLNFVPNIGSIIAAVPAVMLAALQGGIDLALLTALGFLVVNMVVGNVIEPRVMGNGLGLSTLVVFLSLVFWGWLLGPVGMLLSVPLTMLIKIAVEDDDELGWIAVLMDSGAATEGGAGPRSRQG